MFVQTGKLKGIGLSVVIPTVNSANRIDTTIKEVFDKCTMYRKLGLINSFEILPVAQISGDQTFAVLHKYDTDRVVHPHYLSKRGKGLGINYGILKSSKDWCLLIDDDLNYPLNFLLDAIPMTEKYDVIIASRMARKNMPIARRVASLAYRKFAHALFNLKGIYDIQAGEKLVKRDVFCHQKHEDWELLLCRKVHLTEHGFVIDTELLHQVKSLGYKICEIPIVYVYQENFLKLSWAWLDMGKDLLKLRWRTWKKQQY